MEDSHGALPWKEITFFLLTIGILLLCALLLRPFFSAIAGAVILAVVTQRPYDWLATKIKNRFVCAAAGLVLVTLAVIVPIFFLAQEIGEQAYATINAFRAGAHQDKIASFIANRPSLAARLEAFTSSIDVTNAARSTAAYLGGNFAGFVGNSVRMITQLVVMLFLLFFLFRDRALALASLRSLLPLRDHETDELLTRISDTILATALGRSDNCCGSRGPRRPRVLGARRSRSHSVGLHANRMRHDSGFRIFSRLGAGGALSWTHWPLGKSRTPRAVGWSHRQYHRQHSLSDSCRLAPPGAYRDHPALRTWRHRAVRSHRDCSGPSPVHRCDRSPGGLAFPHIQRGFTNLITGGLPARAAREYGSYAAMSQRGEASARWAGRLAEGRSRVRLA